MYNHDDLKKLLDEYLAAHYVPEDFVDSVSDRTYAAESSEPAFAALSFSLRYIDFDKIIASKSGETFSEMLLRLIEESGEKPSTIYTRAHIDRQLFSRIKNNKDYQPHKDTAIAFAVALKLDMPAAQKFLSSAGYTFTNSKRDIIISCFIEHEIFDTDLIDDYLYDYGEPVLLDKKNFCRRAVDNKNKQAVYNPPKLKEGIKMENVTELVFILDKSGSMSGLESDTIGGFNSMIKKQQSEDEGTAFVSTILFNDRSQVLHDRIPIDKVEPLTDKDYSVGGTTALLDAVGDAIKHIRNIHKYAREEDRPPKTVFVITTDGEENSSRKFRYPEIKQLIEQQKELGWEFIFLGANIDAAEVAESIGIDQNRAVDYLADKIGTHAVYGAISDFVSCARAMPKFSKKRPDSSWREVLDRDYQNRK